MFLLSVDLLTEILEKDSRGIRSVLGIDGYVDLRGPSLMRCLARGHLCRSDALVSSPLCLPPCSPNLSTMGRRSESLEEDLFNTPNNWIIVMWIKCGVELKRLQMFFRPTAAHCSSLQWIFARQTWAKMAAEVGWLSLAAEGFWRERAPVGQSKSCFVQSKLLILWLALNSYWSCSRSNPV